MTLDLSNSSLIDRYLPKYLMEETPILLDVTNSDLSDEGCIYIQQYFKGTKIKAEYNNISDEGCKYLSNIKTLLDVKLFHNNISYYGLVYLCTSTSLISIDLEGNDLLKNFTGYFSQSKSLINIYGKIIDNMIKAKWCLNHSYNKSIIDSNGIVCLECLKKNRKLYKIVKKKAKKSFF